MCGGRGLWELAPDNVAEAELEQLRHLIGVAIIQGGLARVPLLLEDEPTHPVKGLMARVERNTDSRSVWLS
jgi:hypothetical protein